MPIHVPRPLEPEWQGVIDRASGRPVSPRALSAMVERLSAKYQGQEVTLAPSDERVARLRFFLPRDLLKPALPLAELVASGGLPPRPLRIVDVGAGVGASMLGAVRAFDAAVGRGSVASVTAIDRDASALAALGRMVSEARRAALFPEEVRVETMVGDFASPESLEIPGGPFDVVLAADAFVEATDATRNDVDRGAVLADLALRWLEHPALAPDASLVLLEPATRPASRALHHARARILEAGKTLSGPCTHDGPCPMLVRERDWCHEDLSVDLPSWLHEVARGAGLRWQGLTFSQLVVRKIAGASLERAYASEPGWVPVRLVSTPRRTKGKTEAFGCTRRRLEEPLRLLQLDRSVARRGDGFDLSRAERGDVVLVSRDALEPEDARPVRVDASSAKAAGR